MQKTFTLACLMAFCGGVVLGQVERTPPPEGVRRNQPAVYALTGARIIVSPQRTIESGTIVIRDRSLVAVGSQVTIPPDAEVIDLKGKWVYAGLVDGYSSIALSNNVAGSAPYWNPMIVPQTGVAREYAKDEQRNEKVNAGLRKVGVTARLVAPDNGILKGSSSLVTTNSEAVRQVVVPSVALHVRLTVSRNRGSGYPNSPMGAVALARQSFYDAQWYHQAWQAYRSDRRLPRPESNDALAALQTYLQDNGLVIIDAQNELYAQRADRLAREFGLRAVLRGSGREYRRLEAIRRAGRAVLLPINFPRPPNVGASEAAADVRLERLMHWDLAPENPGRLERADVEFALTSDGLKDPKQLLENVRVAIARGLTPQAALRALTVTPSRLFGVGDRMGTVEPGKMASLVVADGRLFDEKTKILETWVDGRRYRHKEPPVVDPVGVWSGKSIPKKTAWSLAVEGQPNKLKATLKWAGKSHKFAKISFRDARLSGIFRTGSGDSEGVAQLTLVVDARTQTALGTISWPDGSIEQLQAERAPLPAATKAKTDKEKTKTDKEKTAPPTIGEATKKKTRGKPSDLHPAIAPINYPLGAFGISATPAQAESVLFTNATIWTSGPKGVLENASLLIAKGKIVAVGVGIQAPAGTKTIDLGGKHLSPGIIDCHSHMATDGGVNESGQSITAEVRIGDFIDSDDINIYRQLAGGVTSSNILHGSANPIGGQNQVIKLRWGALPEEMKFARAPAGIKFALGENVKQSNRREP